jgi:Tfp pilus assembly protein PilO
MQRIAWNAPGRLLLVLSGVLLVLGVVVDAAFTRGQLNGKRRMKERREVLQADLRPIQAREQQARDAAAALGSPDLESAIRALKEEDPVTLVGRMVSAAGLVGREMIMEGVNVEGELTCTRFFLRMQGSYRNITALVRDLETGDRLVSVDALAIEQQGEGSALEARLNVSVYSP